MTISLIEAPVGQERKQIFPQKVSSIEDLKKKKKKKKKSSPRKGTKKGHMCLCVYTCVCVYCLYVYACGQFSHDKGRGMCYLVCGMVHIKEPLLLIDKSSLCGGSGFPFSLSEWSLTICLTPYNRR